LGHLAVELLRRVFGARFDDLSLVAEVLIHGASRDVGGPGDVDDRRFVQPMPAEAGDGGLDDELARVGRRRLDGHDGARISALVGTPVPEVTSTCSTSSTWLWDVPRTCRTPSVMPFMPWM